MFVCLFVFFLSATRDFLLCGAASESESRSRRGRPRGSGQAHAQREHARACRTRYNFSTKKSYADPFQKTKPYARACCCIRNYRDFQKKGKRKPTCHFTSSVYSSPSLGVFTFRIVLNRILHKSSLLAPMESRRTRRPTFTAEERLERRREQDRRRHAERRAGERREQTQALREGERDVDRLRSSHLQTQQLLDDLQRIQS